MKTHTTSTRCGGFSMIEVLVASTILVVIVMMLGMLFQQTSLAWRTGVKRADAFMQIRGFVGALQRDASAAVDASKISPALTSKVGGGPQSFSGSALQFYTLTGAGFNQNGNGPIPLRALTYVEYSTDGVRRETKLQANGSQEGPVKMNVMTTVTRASDPNRPQVSVSSFATDANYTGQGLPAYITFKADVQASGYNLEIGAASAGPDKTWNTKDDIRTWTK